MELVEIQSKKLEVLVKQLAEFTAMYEASADKIERHELLTGQRLANVEAQFNRQITSINDSLGDFKDLLSETGIARWRIAAEQSLKMGEEHLEQLQQACRALLSEIASGMATFENIREAAVVQISEATRLIGLDEFRQSTQQYRDTLETQTDSILKRLQKSTNWFYWQRVVMIVVVGILSSLVTSFILTNQMPWETNAKVSLEREAGRTLLKAWPHLSKSDQTYLQDLSGNHFSLA